MKPNRVVLGPIQVVAPEDWSDITAEVEAPNKAMDARPNNGYGSAAAVATARTDHRDALAWAEYPQEVASPSWRVPPDEAQRIRETDRSQYVAWLRSVLSTWVEDKLDGASVVTSAVLGHGSITAQPFLDMTSKSTQADQDKRG